MFFLSHYFLPDSGVLLGWVLLCMGLENILNEAYWYYWWEKDKSGASTGPVETSLQAELRGLRCQCCSACRLAILEDTGSVLVLFSLAKRIVNFLMAASSSFYYSPKEQHTHSEFSEYWLMNKWLTKCMEEQINKWMNKDSSYKSLVSVITHWGQSDFCFIDCLYMRDLRILCTLIVSGHLNLLR